MLDFGHCERLPNVQREGAEGHTAAASSVCVLYVCVQESTKKFLLQDQ